MSTSAETSKPEPKAAEGVTVPPPGFQGKGPYLLLALAVAFADQVTKAWVEATIPYRGSMPVFEGWLNLIHVRNTGVAFGLLASDSPAGPWLLAGLGLVALGAVLVYFRWVSDQQPLVLTALALIMGGAVGNLLDRIFAGAVTDFVDVYYGTYHWHTFNVADTAITVAVFFLIADAYLGWRRERR